MDKWISVKDRLPESGEKVLSYENGEISERYFHIWANGPSWSILHGRRAPTHWMPLPEPPKEVKKDPKPQLWVMHD